jgi:ribosomal protein S18 acetylase RimI-like enzyme
MSNQNPTLSKLTPQQRALLARRLAESRAPAPAASEIVRQAGEGPWPLAYSQQRLWFLDQLDPGNSAYNVYRAVRIQGPLDRGALAASLRELVRRHEPLRTVYREDNGQLVQIVSPVPAVDLAVLDLSGLPAAEREAEVLRLANEEAHCAFDLAQGPLLRAGLLRLGPEEHVLLLTTHHIAADGWSVGVLFNDLGALYGALAAGKPSPLPELPVRYVDYACWQREWLQGPVLARQLAYWKQQLAGAAPFLELPTDHPRPEVQQLVNFRGARHYLLFPRPLLDGLVELSRQKKVTLFMTLLAAAKVLLWRASGQEDIVVGSPIAGRNRPELEGLVGCFSNTLALRTNLSGNPTFAELLERVRETALGALGHADTPFEKLVEELRPVRVPNRMTLFQVNFRLLTAPLPLLKFSGLDLKFLDVDNHMAKFDLAFEFCARPEGLGGYVEYFTDLYEPSTIARMCDDLEGLLGAVTANPDTLLAALTGRTVPREGRATMKPEDTAAPAKGPRGISRKPLAISVGRESAAPAGAKELPQYTLRKATMKDCDFIYRLRRLTLKDYVTSAFPHWTAEQQDAYYLDFDPAHHYIVVVDGKDIGDWAIRKTEKEHRFLNLHLLPEYQNRGLGSAILKAAIVEAAAQGALVVSEVLKTNPAMQLYYRLGFTITDENELRYVITIPPPSPVVSAPGEPTKRGPRGIKRRGIELSGGANSDRIETGAGPRTTGTGPPTNHDR